MALIVDALTGAMPLEHRILKALRSWPEAIFRSAAEIFWLRKSMVGGGCELLDDLIKRGPRTCPGAHKIWRHRLVSARGVEGAANVLVMREERRSISVFQMLRM